MRAVNLLPAEQRKGAGGPYGRSDGAAYVVVGFVTGLCVLGVMWGMARHALDSDQAQSQTLTAQAADATEQASRLAPYESFISLSQQRQQAVAVLAGSRFDWAHAFHELGRVLPSDVALISVTGSMTAAAPSTSTTTTTTTTTSASTTAAAPPVAASSSITPPGTVPTLSLQACATSQAEVALALQRLQLMDGVQSVTLISSAQGSATSASTVAAQPVNGTSDPSSSAPAYCPASFNADISFQPLPAITPPASSTLPASVVSTASTTTTTTEAGS